MGHALKRMAYSPAAQQVEDLGGGLFTVDGREICESDTTPMHIGSIPAYIRGFMRRLEGKVEPGDIIIHNNPYHGASHSPDLCVAIPIFWEGELTAWSASTIHLSDTGGVFPGIAIDVHDVWAESKIYDSLKLYERGVRNEQLWQFFIDNTRTPSYVVGDTEAMIAAGRLGEKRFLGLLEKYGRDTVLDRRRGVPRLLRADDARPDRVRARRHVGGRGLARRRRAQPRRAALRPHEGDGRGLRHHRRPLEVLRQRRHRLQRAVRRQRPARASTP